MTPLIAARHSYSITLIFPQRKNRNTLLKVCFGLALWFWSDPSTYIKVHCIHKGHMVNRLGFCHVAVQKQRRKIKTTFLKHPHKVKLLRRLNPITGHQIHHNVIRRSFLVCVSWTLTQCKVTRISTPERDLLILFLWTTGLTGVGNIPKLWYTSSSTPAALTTLT